MALVCGLLGVVAETIVSLLRVHSQPTETVTLPEFGMFGVRMRVCVCACKVSASPQCSRRCLLVRARIREYVLTCAHAQSFAKTHACSKASATGLPSAFEDGDEA